MVSIFLDVECIPKHPVVRCSPECVVGRRRFVACRDQTGSFPEIPDEEAGGSKVIFDPPPPPPAEEDGGDDDGGKKGKKGKKGSGKKEKKGKKGKKGKGDADGDDAPTGPAPSVFIPMIDASSDLYHESWQSDSADAANFHQKHDSELIKRQKRLEVEEELRVQVDILMREELKNLKAAVEAGGKKGKAKKAKKPKKAKGGKKGKKEKDMTADRTPDSIFEELVREGIAKRVSPMAMSDFIGQYSHLGTHILGLAKEPTPSLADVRRVVTQYCVLPLGSQAVHETQPNHIKSLLLVGPHGVGKKTLANAVAHELGANFFDLSPSNTAGKYTAKKGLEGVDGLLHKVFKVARLFSPSVVYIGNACSVHVKKKNKDDPFDSTRMKKELPKVIKGMKAGERTIVIGTDHSPFDADMKQLDKVYQKVVSVPRPDYGSLHMLWRSILTREGAKDLGDELDLSSLSKISDGYTAGDITKVVREVLTPRRIAILPTKPLTAAEMIPGLAKLDPVTIEEEDAFKSWMAKTPLGKKREKKNKPADGDDGGGKKGKKKGSGKKKKKK